MIELTRIDNDRKAPLTKTFMLRDGELLQLVSAKPVHGRAVREEIKNIHQLAGLIDSLEPHQALAYGVAEDREVEIVTKAEWSGNPKAITRTRECFRFRPAPSIMFLDHDPRPEGPAISVESLRNALIEARPELEAAPMLAVASASTFVYQGEREWRGAGGWHLYVVVADGSDIERAGKALYEHCWRATIESPCAGYYRVSKSGQLLDRGPIDASVWQPERLDFAAGARCIPPLERRRPPSRIWNGDTPPFDTRQIANLTGKEIETAARHRAIARAAVEDERSKNRAAYRSDRITELATGGIDKTRAGDVIDQALNHSALLGDFLLTKSDGNQVTVAEVLAGKDRFHQMRFGDPLEPEYRDDHRIAYANLYGGGRPYIYSHAHGGRRFELYPQQRTLRLQRGEQPRQADQAIDLMRLAADVYNRPVGGGRYSLVYVREGHIIEADEAWLRDYLGRLVKFERFDKRSKQWEPADVPLDLVKAILGLKTNDRNLPLLNFVISDPVMRLDGSILDTPGYSAQDGLLFVSDVIDPPRVPLRPTEDQAKAAFKTIWRPFKEFPFPDADSRAVLLAALVTAFMRPMLPTSPAFAFDAPKAGSGKSLLAVCICALCGIPSPVNPPPKDDDEARKTLFAALRNAERVILWDNYTQPVYGNSAICAFITASQYAGRVLGHSEHETLPNRAMLLLTGNNLRVHGDACRRVMVCRIDAGTEHPESREFQLAPAQHVRQHRTEIRFAILTLLRSFHSRGAPKQTNDTAGSFEDWDRHVRQFVVWLGQTRMTDGVPVGDPFKTAQANIEDDLHSDSLGDIIHGLREVFEGRSFTAGDVLLEVSERPDAGKLSEALATVQGDRGSFSSKGLGRWLKKHRDQPVNGLKIKALRDPATNTLVFAVVPLKEQAAAGPSAAQPALLDPLLL